MVFCSLIREYTVNLPTSLFFSLVSSAKKKILWSESSSFTGCLVDGQGGKIPLDYLPISSQQPVMKIRISFLFVFENCKGWNTVFCLDSFTDPDNGLG